MTPHLRLEVSAAAVDLRFVEWFKVDRQCDSRAGVWKGGVDSCILRSHGSGNVGWKGRLSSLRTNCGACRCCGRRRDRGECREISGIGSGAVRNSLGGFNAFLLAKVHRDQTVSIGLAEVIASSATFNRFRLAQHPRVEVLGITATAQMPKRTVPFQSLNTDSSNPL